MVIPLAVAAHISLLRLRLMVLRVVLVSSALLRFDYFRFCLPGPFLQLLSQLPRCLNIHILCRYTTWCRRAGICFPKIARLNGLVFKLRSEGRQLPLTPSKIS